MASTGVFFTAKMPTPTRMAVASNTKKLIAYRPADDGFNHGWHPGVLVPVQLPASIRARSAPLFGLGIRELADTTTVSSAVSPAGSRRGLHPPAANFVAQERPPQRQHHPVLAAGADYRPRAAPPGRAPAAPPE